MIKYFITFCIIVFAFAACNTKDQETASIQTNTNPDSVYNKLTDEEKRLPKNALAGLEVAGGLQATLFASEPMIGNPTNIDVDAKGRVWMCEAYNYRPKLNPDHPQKAAGDRILILEDTNGDGVADTAKVFYQGNDVNAALGIAVLGNKVIVSCSPNVFLFTDTNGDDKPDTKEVLFTHVGGEQHDHAVHAFTYGPDGKLYFNFGNAGERLMDKNGKIIVDKDGNEVNNSGKPYRQGMVFRMNEDGTGLEVLAHNFRNNYEVAVDAFGTMWQSDNDDDGNQSTRINYVMQYGNYGYTDEMTGAGWRAKRTNMEPEIPKRHWHQNDPGSIPNLLPTGAGSPAGMCVYEGDLLPAVFQNQMIHCEAGNNVVRAYPVQKNGAGYTATIQPILEGKKDQWFRPVDVCTAPDGSIFVADWYDPGVGGHQMADMNRGRIYRIAPATKKYTIPKMDLSTVEGGVVALQSPNLATRYLAWQTLKAAGTAAEKVLQELYNSPNQQWRARALWLLANIPGKQDQYISQGLADKNPDMRITALRAAGEITADIIPYVKKVVSDTDQAVRREGALALHHNKSAEAAGLWADLALQYNGTDRWYLEALGIGADQQWDAFLTAWKNKVGDRLYTKAAHDIVWRSRSAMTLSMLAQYIGDDAMDSARRLSYFRAFDFNESAGKQAILLGLLNNTGPNKDAIALTALNHLTPASLASSAKMSTVLNNILDKVKGTQTFIDLAGRFKVKNQNEQLLQIAMTYPDSSIGSEAAGLLLDAGGSGLIKNALYSKDSMRAITALKVIGHAGTKESNAMMVAVIKDASLNTGLRAEAIKVYGNGWGESERLLSLVKEKKLPKDMEPYAAATLSSAYRKDIKNEALKYFNVSSISGKSLPPINELAKLTGNSIAGQPVFHNSCATCHKVDNEGQDFGPALSKIGSKLTKEAILISIIHPDAGISFGYEGYVFKLKDGSMQAGIISSETENAVEIVISGGMKRKMDKSQIASRQEMANSMMPSGLYQSLTQQQLVDLVEFLYSKK